jgi:outer membrane protein TolC
VSGASDVTCLEVKAQSKKLFNPRVSTFAAGSDIHAKPVPQGEANTDYRPGAIGPEMPVLLVGSRLCREQRARDFYGRSVAVVDKTRALIELEAEDAFLKWQEANRKVALYQEATTKGRKLADDTRNDFATGQRVKPEDVLTNEVIASQAQASYNEIRFHLILVLAALERITGGGFCAGLTAQP